MGVAMMLKVKRPHERWRHGLREGGGPTAQGVQAPPCERRAMARLMKESEEREMAEAMDQEGHPLQRHHRGGSERDKGEYQEQALQAHLTEALPIRCDDQRAQPFGGQWIVDDEGLFHGMLNHAQLRG